MTYRLKVIAPLGQEAFQLTGGTAAGVVLETAAGQRYMAPDADRLLRRDDGLGSAGERITLLGAGNAGTEYGFHHNHRWAGAPGSSQSVRLGYQLH